MSNKSKAGARVNTVKLSGEAHKAFVNPSHQDAGEIDTEYLLPAESRGNQSFAFGHFISEAIPDLVNIQVIRRMDSEKKLRVIIYPLEQWSQELLNLFKIDSSILCELDRINVNNLPTYTSLKVKTRFYKCKSRKITIDHIVVPTNNNEGHVTDLGRLIFLSRHSAGPSRPKRWLNMKDIYQKGSLTYTDIEVFLIDPADDGPQEFNPKYTGSKYYVYKCPGSAVYNVLYFTTNPLIVVMNAIPRGGAWIGQLEDLVP